MPEPDEKTERISEAFDAIASYCLRHGWTPVGLRSFSVGPWDVTINGTRETVDNLRPFHASVVHRDLVGLMILYPYGGTVGGWGETEAQFIADMKAAREDDDA